MQRSRSSPNLLFIQIGRRASAQCSPAYQSPLIYLFRVVFSHVNTCALCVFCPALALTQQRNWLSLPLPLPLPRLGPHSHTHHGHQTLRCAPHAAFMFQVAVCPLCPISAMPPSSKKPEIFLGWQAQPTNGNEWLHRGTIERAGSRPKDLYSIPQ